MKGTKPHIRVERDGLGEMPPPDWMTDDAKAEWRRVVPLLAERRILTVADLGGLENYCMAIGMARDMEREIQRLGAIQKVYKIDKDGNSLLVSCRKNPAVAVQADSVNRARLLAAELGLTPVSRSRPTVEDDSEEDELWDWKGA
jgi:P27 family predicted phage terminase small subunit